MNWNKKLKTVIDCALDIIPASQHEEFVNAMIKIVFEYCGGFK